MADSNNNLFNPAWYPPDKSGLTPGGQDWAKLLTQYVWTLRNQGQEVTQQIQNFNNTILQAVTNVFNQFNNNGGIVKPPVVYGTHLLRLTAAYVPGAWTGYIFVETDRFQAAYYSNGTQWVLIEGTGAGSFEGRWTGLNSYDAGLTWIETSRSNLNGTPPYPTYRWDGNNWAFLSGRFYRTQAQLGTLAATFFPANANGGNDLGALVSVTDFHHELQWSLFSGTANTNNSNTVAYVVGDVFDTGNGWVGFPIVIGGNNFSVVSVANNAATLTANANVATGNNVAWSIRAWAWGPNDDLRAGEGPIMREVDPSPLTGWQLYAGNNNVTYLKSDATLGTVNLPNLSGSGAGNNAFPRFGEVSSNNNINPPVAPIFTGNAATGNVSGTFAGAGTASVTTGSFDTGGNNTGSAVVSVDSVSVAGNITASFTGNNVTGTISNNGVPLNVVRRAWFRR